MESNSFGHQVCLIVIVLPATKHSYLESNSAVKGGETDIAQYHKFYGISRQVFYAKSGRHKQIWWYFDLAGAVLFYSDEICDQMCRVCNNQGK